MNRAEHTLYSIVHYEIRKEKNISLLEVNETDIKIYVFRTLESWTGRNQ